MAAFAGAFAALPTAREPSRRNSVSLCRCDATRSATVVDTRFVFSFAAPSQRHPRRRGAARPRQEPWPDGIARHAQCEHTARSCWRPLRVRTLRALAKPSVVHECTECGHESVRSYGKCPNCGAWNSLVERVVRKASSARPTGLPLGARGGAGRRPLPASSSSSSEAMAAAARRQERAGERFRTWVGADAEGASNAPRTLEELRAEDAARRASVAHGPSVDADGAETTASCVMEAGAAMIPRVLPTRSVEFNRVFGGGIVPGSVSLIGGEPGVAKSTLALQVAADIAQVTRRAATAASAAAAAKTSDGGFVLGDSAVGAPVVYVSGEESVEQVRARAERIVFNTESADEDADDDDGADGDGAESGGNRDADNGDDDRSGRRTNDDSVLGAAQNNAGGARRGRNGRRASRARGDNLYLLNESCIESILDVAERMQPALVVIDSIQTVYTLEADGGGRPGSITQIRESAHRLLMAAKAHGTMAVLLVGHVTKTGDIAGPRLLEHLVDTVVYMEGERNSNHRLLRGVKNRFGATETGVFDLTRRGLVDVRNPSLVFLDSGRRRGDAYTDTDNGAGGGGGDGGGDEGSAVGVVLDGNRGFLVEIQALASESYLPQPRRTANGVEVSRVHVILAVLGKRAGLRFGNRDVYVNATAGARVQDPAADLAMAVALASSLVEKRVRRGTVFVGEIGLGGEVRNVPRADLRFRDAARLGFRRCVCSDRVNEDEVAAAAANGMELVRCANVKQALHAGMV